MQNEKFENRANTANNPIDLFKRKEEKSNGIQ